MSSLYTKIPQKYTHFSCIRITYTEMQRGVQLLAVNSYTGIITTRLASHVVLVLLPYMSLDA